MWREGSWGLSQGHQLRTPTSRLGELFHPNPCRVSRSTLTGEHLAAFIAGRAEAGPLPLSVAAPD
jgi:hypothetical protein